MKYASSLMVSSIPASATIAAIITIILRWSNLNAPSLDPINPPTSTTFVGGNMTFVGNMSGGRSMTMPGGNMTFGASLQNAKMHLMEAIVDLKNGYAKGAIMEMNLTDQGIKMHEQEIKSMMMEVKSMMAHKGNTKFSPMVSKNATL